MEKENKLQEIYDFIKFTEKEQKNDYKTLTEPLKNEIQCLKNENEITLTVGNINAYMG